MISRIDISNGKIFAFDENGVAVGSLSLYEKVKYNEVSYLQKHVALLKTGSVYPKTKMAGSIIIDTTLEEPQAICIDSSGKKVNTYIGEQGKHFRVKSFIPNLSYGINSVFAENLELYYANKDNVSAEYPSKVESIDINNIEERIICNANAKNVKSISDNEYIYDVKSEVFVYNSRHNSIIQIGVLNNETKSYSVVRGDILIEILNSGEIVCKDESFPELDFIPSSICSTRENIYVLSEDKILYKAKMRDYMFSIINDYSGSDIEDIISVYKDLVLVRTSSGNQSCRVLSLLDNRVSVDIELTSNRTYGLTSGYNICLSSKDGSAVGQAIIPIQKNFTHLTPSEYFKINGRSETYETKRSINNIRENTVSSPSLIGESLAIVDNKIYIVSTGKIYEIDISSGLQNINNNTARVESNNITYHAGYNGLYYNNGYMYMYSKDNKILKMISVDSFAVADIDLSDKINSGIRSMFVSDDGYEINILSNLGTMYVITNDTEEVISASTIDNTTEETDVIYWYRSEVLVSNISSSSKAIYYVEKSTGERSTDAAIVVSGLSTDKFKMIKSGENVFLHYGENGRLDMYSRHDKVRRVR